MLWEDFSGSLEIPLSQNVTIKIIGTDGYSAQTPQDYKTQTTSAFDALKEFADANDIEIEYGNTTLGVYIKSIANIQPQKCSYWAFLVNGQMSNVGVGDYKVQQGDTLIFCYEGFYSYIDGQEPEENESFLIKMDKVGYDSTLQLQKTTNIEGAQVTYNGSTKLTGSDGSASFVATSGSKPAVVELAKEKDGALWEDYSHTIIIDVKVTAATPTPTPTPTPEGSGGGDSSPKVYLKVVGDGTLILGRKSLTLVSGDTPISILKREVSDVVTTGSGTSVYVNKIGSLAEFDKGPQSGWKFKINGEVKNLSAGACKLKDGDEVEWFYVYTEDQAYARVNVTIKIIGTDGYSAQTPQDYKTQTTFAFDALKEFTDANDIEIEYENTAFGVYIQSIANIQPQKCSYWAFLVNGQMSSVGAGDYEVQPGDTLIFSYEGFYSYIDVQEPVENEPFSVKMVKIGCDTTLQAQKVTSIEGAQVTYNDIVKQTDSTGSASFVAAVGSKPLVVELAKENDSALWEDFSQTITVAAKVPTPTQTPTPTPTATPSGGGSSSSKAYLKVVGDGSVILNRKSVILQNGDTPITILKREVSGVVTSGSGSGAYVSKIGDLAEFDRGAQSGWKFKLNGDVKNLSAGAFILKDGDEVEWFYVYTVSQTSSGRGAVTPTSTPIPTQSASPTATDAPMENITRLADKKGVQVLAQAMTLDGFAPMILAAAGQSSDAIAQMIVNHVVENKGKYRKVTDIERMAINAVKLGLDAENIGGYNLIEAIISHENIEMQGLNGVVFGLLALDMVEVKGNYSGPNTKEALLQKIIARQNENGGFALDGTNSEVDMTAFAITALAPYHNRENVRSTIEKALSWLDSVKTAAGEYQSADGEENCESLSWVIIAKSAMGVDAANEIKLLSAYELSSGYFSHLKNGQQDMMATEQALMAICAYEKNKNGQGSFFGSQKDYIFTDTKDISPWAVTFIASAAQKGIVKGDDAGRVNPQKKLTRSELITMLLRIANLHADSSIPAQFKDVVPTDWFYGYVMIGYREGFIKGYSEDTFGPQGLVSRQEMAVIAARMLKLSDIDNRPVDYDLASDWAKDAVEAVFTAGIMTGDGTNFNPKDEMTREQAIKTVLLIGEQYK